MKLLFTLAVLSLLCVAPAYSQQNKGDSKPPKGLIFRYDKFRDQTLVLTKPFNLFFSTGKRSFSCTAVFAYMKAGDRAPSTIALAVSPGGTGFLASLAEGIDKSAGGNMGNVYFDPDSDVIILVGGQRFKFGRVSKDYGLTPNGDLKTSIAVEVSIDAIQAIVNSDEWEIAVGSLESKVNKRYAKGIKEKLSALEAQFKKDSEASASH